MKECKLKGGRAFTIREAQADDADTILEYVNRCAGETDYFTFGAGEFDVSLEEEKEFLQSCRETGNKMFYLALVQDKIIGNISFVGGHRQRIAHSGEMAISVSQAYWGQGVAKPLVNTLHSWARENGVTKINLKVREDNARAIAFYENYKYIHEGRLSREFSVDGIYYDTLLMGRIIE